MPSRKAKMRPDPTLAKPHAAGTQVIRVHRLQHENLGAISIPYDPPPMYWRVHFDLAIAFAGRLEELRRQLLDFPVGPCEDRMVDDPYYRHNVYAAGSQSIVNATLACQHLTDEIERSYPQASLGSSSDPKARMVEGAKLASMDSPADHKGWSALGEIVALRNSIEHPDRSTYLNRQDPLKVPLAWMLSERPSKVLPLYKDLFTNYARQWQEVVAAMPSTVVRITVQRGMKATRGEEAQHS